MIVPFAVWRPVTSHSGLMTAHQGLVLHVQVGNNSCYGQFANPANQASSTWWVSKTGVLEQYVDSDLAAWAEAAGNFTWDSVETEGVPAEPLTAAQIATLARLYAWGHTAYGWPLTLAETPAGRGLGWHGMGGGAWGGHPSCPGDLRKNQRAAILAAAVTPGGLMAAGVEIRYTKTGLGYWIVDADGGVFTYGDAPFHGSVPGVLKPGQTLNAPIVSFDVLPDETGYVMLGADNGVFTFGAAVYYGHPA